MSSVELASLCQLIMTRFRLFFREPAAIFWIFIFPIVLAAGLGIAFRNRPSETLPVGVTTTQLMKELATSNGLTVKTMDEAAGTRALTTGSILLLAIQKSHEITYKYDNTNPDARMAHLLADAGIQRAAGRRDVLAIADEFITEPGSRYIDFVVPGLLGMNVMGSALWGIGYGVVDARQKGQLKRLVASPMQRWAYLLSYLLSGMLMLVIQVIAFVAFARQVFGVPFRGSIGQFAFICVLTSFAFSALGLLIASRVRTIEAVSGLMNLAIFPMWILSGVFFSSARFPAAIQPVVQALPLTAAIDALRENMLQGVDIRHMFAPILILLIWLLIPFAIALRFFRWT